MEIETLKNQLLKPLSGEVIILAFPHGAAADVAKAIGSVADGKAVIDVSNAVTRNMELASTL